MSEEQGRVAIGRRGFLQAACATSALGVASNRQPAAAGSGRETGEENQGHRSNPEWKAEFDEYGFIVLRELISRSAAFRLAERVKEIFGRRPGAGTPDQHLAGLWNYLDPKDDSDFLPLVTQPVCLDLAQRLLGDGFQMTEVGCRLRRPGALSGPVHVTRPLDAIGDAGLPMPNVCFVLAFSWMLNDLTRDMGATLYLPFSHHAPRGPRRGVAYRHFVAIEAPAGSVVIHHGALWHHFGPNNTKRQDRLGLMGGYFPRWMDPVTVGWQPMKRSVRDRLPHTIRAMNSHVADG